MAASNQTVGDVAKLLGVSQNTVRNWCDWHAAHLSDSAKARPRRFTDKDLATFNLIANYRSSGFSTSTINERLAETQVQPGEILAPAQEPVDKTSQTEDIQMPMVMLQQHSEALQRLTTRLEQQHTAEVKALAGEVSTLRTWLLIMAAIMIVIIVGVVASWGY